MRSCAGITGSTHLKPHGERSSADRGDEVCEVERGSGESKTMWRPCFSSTGLPIGTSGFERLLRAALSGSGAAPTALRTSCSILNLMRLLWPPVPGEIGAPR